jgi:hypothetical protein
MRAASRESGLYSLATPAVIKQRYSGNDFRPPSITCSDRSMSSWKSSSLRSSKKSLRMATVALAHSYQLAGIELRVAQTLQHALPRVQPIVDSYTYLALDELRQLGRR